MPSNWPKKVKLLNSKLWQASYVRVMLIIYIFIELIWTQWKLIKRAPKPYTLAQAITIYHRGRESFSDITAEYFAAKLTCTATGHTSDCSDGTFIAVCHLRPQKQGKFGHVECLRMTHIQHCICSPYHHQGTLHTAQGWKGHAVFISKTKGRIFPETQSTSIFGMSKWRIHINDIIMTIRLRQ